MSMRRFARWLANNTVWQHGNIQATEVKYRNLKRLWLPLYDGVAIACGLLTTFAGGLPSLNALFPQDVVQFLGIMLTVVAAASIFGTVLPRFWMWEVFGRMALVGIIVSYIGALAFLGAALPDANRLAVTAMVALGLPLPLFRMDLIGDEIRERRDGVL